METREMTDEEINLVEQAREFSHMWFVVVIFILMVITAIWMTKSVAAIIKGELSAWPTLGVTVGIVTALCIVFSLLKPLIEMFAFYYLRYAHQPLVRWSKRTVGWFKKGEGL